MSLMRRFDEVARRRPDAQALVSSAETLTYAQLRRRVEALAGALVARGVGREVPVGVAIPRSLASMVAVLGVLRAGGAYVPIDPAYPEARQRRMASDAACAVTIVDGRVATAPGWIAEGASLDLGGLDEGLAAPPLVEMPPEGLFNVLYTSGSTGHPKGVCGTHGAMLNRLRWADEALPFEGDEVIAHRSSLSFVDAGPEMFSGLLAGVPTAVILPDELRDLARFVAALERHRVTRITVVPSILAALVRSVRDLGAMLPALRTWITSGEELTLPLLRAFRAAHPAATLVNLYGSTEVTGDATCARFSPGEALPVEAVPIGHAMAGAELLVRDVDGREAREGALFIGGPVLARGYHRRPKEEAERFQRHPERHAARVFATGDLVRRGDNGALYWLGRVDNLVKVRGVRIELEEVERCLRACAASVRDVAVVLVEGDQLVAAVTPEDLDVDAVRAVAQRALPAAMVPARVVAMAALPLLPNGKCDRRALAHACRRARAEIAPERLPHTETERRVAAVWASLLRRDDIARDDTFGALGGDSLTLAEVMLRLGDVAPGRVSLALANDGTLADVARALDGEVTKAPTHHRDEVITLTPMGDEGARDPAVVALLVEASADAAIPWATELPAHMDAARARAYCRETEGVVIRVNGEPVGAGCLQRHPNVGEGVETPPRSVQLDEWLVARWQGRRILSEEGAWPLLAAWMAERADFEVGVVWEDHLAMLAILRARGYTRLGRSWWTSAPDGDGTSGFCEVWCYDLRPHRAAR